MNLYLNLGANSLGSWHKQKVDLNITDDWLKAFVEPNPEHWINDNIDEQIKLIPNATLIKKAIASKNGFCDLYTRADLVNHTGDSAATIQSVEFLKNSIGGDFQQNPQYKIYHVECITIESILKDFTADNVYIKMDIEGAEFEILEQFPFEYLPRIKALFVEFHAHNDAQRQRRDAIISNFSYLGIEIQNWD